MIKKLITLFKLGRKVAKSDMLKLTLDLRATNSYQNFIKIFHFHFLKKKN